GPILLVSKTRRPSLWTGKLALYLWVRGSGLGAGEVGKLLYTNQEGWRMGVMFADQLPALVVSGSFCSFWVLSVDGLLLLGVGIALLQQK
uniref:hypothetical protein n=1 Tax=Salmonella sp. s36468 TaxID=3159641 RepID=UPI00397EF0D7